MAKHVVTPILPPPIDEERFSRNGMVPNAVLMKRLAEGFNFVACRAKKQVFMKCQPLDSVAAGDPANLVWPMYFRTGENTTGLYVAFGAALTDYGFSSPPEVNLIVKNTVPTTVIDESWTFPASSAGVVVVPSELNHVQDRVLGLAANTEYQAYWQLTNGARLVYASLTEGDTRHADDSVAAICSPGEYMAEGPIYDAHLAELVTANNELWQHNGSHLIGWCSDYDTGDAPLVSSFPSRTTYTNLIDGSSTSVSAASAGWNLFTQYHNTLNRTTVPVKFCVRTDRVAGAGTLDIRLTDGTNSIGFTGLGDLNETWSVMTGTIPAQAGTKWDLQCKVSTGATDHAISAIALFEYDA